MRKFTRKVNNHRGIPDTQMLQIEEMWQDKLYKSVQDIQRQAWEMGYSIGSIKLPQEMCLCGNCRTGSNRPHLLPHIELIHTDLGDVQVYYN